jgi:mono/diheme cytochrome c family protein
MTKWRVSLTKRIFIVGFLLLLSLRAEDFISNYEYGQMLYANPRGVACIPCHGETGEGRKIVSYRDDDGKKRELYGADIRRVSLNDMRRAIRNGPGVMPKYFLTDREIEAIYEYIKTVNDSHSRDIDTIEW